MTTSSNLDLARSLFAGWLDDERVLVLHRVTGRGKSSGLAVQETQRKGASLFGIGGGRVTRLVAHAPREEAFGDLGIVE